MGALGGACVRLVVGVHANADQLAVEVPLHGFGDGVVTALEQLGLLRMVELLRVQLPDRQPVQRFRGVLWRAAREAVEVEQHAGNVATRVAAHAQRRCEVGRNQIGAPVARPDVLLLEHLGIDQGAAVLAEPEPVRDCATVVRGVQRHAPAKFVRKDVRTTRRDLVVLERWIAGTVEVDWIS